MKLVEKAVERLPFLIIPFQTFFKYLCTVKFTIASFLIPAIVLLSTSCREDVDTSALQVYDGPINSATNVHLMVSDSAIVRSEIRALKQLEYANGDQEFPEGIDIQFFEKDGQLSTTIKADRGYFDKNENQYRGVGNVQVHNILKDQKLLSEELYWKPREKRIFTEKFVTVQDGGTLINGTGLEADDSFSDYEIKAPRDSRILVPGEGI